MPTETAKDYFQTTTAMGPRDSTSGDTQRQSTKITTVQPDPSETGVAAFRDQQHGKKSQNSWVWTDSREDYHETSEGRLAKMTLPVMMI